MKTREPRLTARLREVDPTSPFRRHAVWLFPGVFLIHSLIIYGVYPIFFRASLALALGSAVGGLAIRWVRNATTVLALAVFLLAFLMLYIMGIAAPIALLAISNQRGWIPWSGLLSSILLLSALSWRVRVSLRNEWSESLEKTPGVVVNMNDHTLVRYPGASESAFASIAALLMLAIFVPLLFLARGSSTYRLVAFVLGPVCIAILGTEFVARGLTYCWVARRWEIAHGVRLKVPPFD